MIAIGFRLYPKWLKLSALEIATALIISCVDILTSLSTLWHIKVLIFAKHVHSGCHCASIAMHSVL